MVNNSQAHNESDDDLEEAKGAAEKEEQKSAQAMEEGVEKVGISNKLDDDPLFILTSQYGFSATMEKVNRAQALKNRD